MKSIDKIKLLIFDLDGTLADTVGSLRDAVNLALTDLGYPTHTIDEVRNAVGHGARKLMWDMLPAENRTEESADIALSRFNARYADVYLNCRECYPGVKEALTELKRAGYLLAVLSNKPNKYTVGLCESLMGHGFFDYLRGMTDAPAKPDPSVPLLICKHFGVTPDECAFVGDSDVDIKTGKNAGMMTISVSWGFKPRNLLESLSPSVIVDNAQELQKIFVPMDAGKRALGGF